MSNPYRVLPSVSQVLESADLKEARRRFAPEDIVSAVRAELDHLRLQISAAEPVGEQALMSSLLRRVLDRLDAEHALQLRPVINATGIILHTNLGRAPLHEDAARAAYLAAKGYINLELDLPSGTRSSRQNPIRAGVCKLTGAEAATAVNNCAAATVLALRAVAAGKELIVSRGQLIEIGGSFRIPEILAVSGATLREIGTTNITRDSDYEQAIGPNTGAILRVHTSNYRVKGFTHTVGIERLVEIGKKHRLPVIDDVGSGVSVDLTPLGFTEEPQALDSIRAGADLVLFSADKLLGGPQAGIVAGKKAWVDKMESDPLMRAFRLDKMTLAALEVTLQKYRHPATVRDELPILRMLFTPLNELKSRTERLAEQLRQAKLLVSTTVLDDVAYVGGGSLPDQSLSTVVIALQSHATSDAELARRLRVGTPAVMSRVRNGQVLLDLRTVFDWQEEELQQAITWALT